MTARTSVPTLSRDRQGAVLQPNAPHHTTAPVRLGLFCFPYAGGGASIFRSWQAMTGPFIHVHPIRLPGRETRISEPPWRSVPGAAEAIASEILASIDGPFAFFGYSFGALLAFETARVLRRRGATPDRLMVAALKAPHLPLRRKPIHQLHDTDFAAEIRKFKGTPEAILQNHELMSLVLPAIKADFTAYETYTYSAEAPLECPITAFGGANDPSVSPEELAAWGEQTSGGFTARFLPGDHFFIHTANHLLTWTVAQELLPPLRLAC